MYNIRVIQKAWEVSLFPRCVRAGAQFKTKTYTKFFRFLPTTSKKWVIRGPQLRL